MKKLIFLLPVLLITVSLFAQSKSSEITGITAKLFYNENSDVREKNVSGTFSENIIDNNDFALWNVIIGAGSAEGYTNQTIVIVTVKSSGFSNIEQTLIFTAKSKDRAILSEKRTFNCINENAEYKILFLLNDTGCEEISIKADLINDGKTVSTMKKEINFECGE
jgi:hypothetical protein